MAEVILHSLYDTQQLQTALLLPPQSNRASVLSGSTLQTFHMGDLELR